MSTIITRAGKGSALTSNEVDSNFTNLDTDKLESADLTVDTLAASGSGALTYTGGLFEFTPPYLESYLTLTDLSMDTPAAASGGGALAYDNLTGKFTFTPADLSSVTTTLEGLTDTTIVSAVVGDLLRHDGTDWKNYPDSNFASSSHNHDSEYLSATGADTAAGMITYTAATGATFNDSDLVIDNNDVNGAARLIFADSSGPSNTSIEMWDDDLWISADDGDVTGSDLVLAVQGNEKLRIGSDITADDIHPRINGAKNLGNTSYRWSQVWGNTIYDNGTALTSKYLQISNIDDTPVNGVTNAPISSNWAYDHAADTSAHGFDGTDYLSATGADTAAGTITFTAATGATFNDSHILIDNNGVNGAAALFFADSSGPSNISIEMWDDNLWIGANTNDTTGGEVQLGTNDIHRLICTDDYVKVVYADLWMGGGNHIVGNGDGDQDIGKNGNPFNRVYSNYVYAETRLETDTITERTGAAGVTIESVLLKDGLVDGHDLGATYDDTNWDSAYSHSIAAHAPTNADNTAANETSHATVLEQSDVDNTPVNGITNAPISSNWAYDHVNVVVDPHTEYQRESEKSNANGYASLDGSGKVPTSELPDSVIGGLQYQGTWNASTNTPTLVTATGTEGHYYVVSVAGSTNLDGITDWKANDWAIYNGTAWEKIDNTDAVSSVNAMTGNVVIGVSELDDVTITSISTGELLNWSGSAWINNTLAEAGIAPVASPTFTGIVNIPDLTLTSMSNQGSEATALMINGSNVVGTRELGSNAFTSTTYEPADGTILKEADVDDTPVNGVTTAPISSNWAYDHAATHAPSDADNTASNETSHADVVQDGDFSSNGIMVRTGAGAYSIITDDSTEWDAGYTHSIAAHAPTNADNTSANETSHSDVVVDGDFSSNGFLKRTSAGVYSVDASVYSVDSHTHAFSEITSKPTTLVGYGITDAAADDHDHVVSEITDFDPTDYLPLTAGVTNPLTGTLRVENGLIDMANLAAGSAFAINHVTGATYLKHEAVDGVWDSIIDMRPTYINFGTAQTSYVGLYTGAFRPVSTYTHANAVDLGGSSQRWRNFYGSVVNARTSLWTHVWDDDTADLDTAHSFTVDWNTPSAFNSNQTLRGMYFNMDFQAAGGSGTNGERPSLYFFDLDADITEYAYNMYGFRSHMLYNADSVGDDLKGTSNMYGFHNTVQADGLGEIATLMGFYNYVNYSNEAPSATNRTYYGMNNTFIVAAAASKNINIAYLQYNNFQTQNNSISSVGTVYGNYTVLNNDYGAWTNAYLAYGTIPSEANGGAITNKYGLWFLGCELSTLNGRLLLGGPTSTNGADYLLAVGNTTESENGISIITSTSGVGVLEFSDSTSAGLGSVRYDHSVNELSLWVNGSAAADQRLVIKDKGYTQFRIENALTDLAGITLDNIDTGISTGEDWGIWFKSQDANNPDQLTSYIANVPLDNSGTAKLSFGVNSLGVDATEIAYLDEDGLYVAGSITLSGTVDGIDLATKATNWDTAYGWGDHASTYEPLDSTLVRDDDAGYNNSDWDTAFGWGNHTGGGYLQDTTDTLTGTLTVTTDVDVGGQVLTDDIVEKTAAAGVTVDGVRLKDGTVFEQQEGQNTSLQLWQAVGVSVIDSYDHTAAAWRGMNIRATNINFNIDDTNVAKVTSAGILVDDIGELTAATGVTIDSVILKDGAVELDAYLSTGNVYEADQLKLYGDSGYGLNCTAFTINYCSAAHDFHSSSNKVASINGDGIQGVWQDNGTANADSLFTKLTQAQYDALTPDDDTIYFIVG